jgi:hypothetical protein
MKLSTFIISLLVVSLFVTGFVVYFAGLNAQYGAGYDNSTNISDFDQWADLSNLTEDLGDQIQEQPQSTGGFNVIGDFLSYGWNTIKITFSSVNIFYDILNTGFDTIPGGYASIAKMQLIIGAIVIVAIVLIFVSILTGRNNL